MSDKERRSRLPVSNMLYFTIWASSKKAFRMTSSFHYVLFIHDLLHDLESPFEIDDLRLAGLLL